MRRMIPSKFEEWIKKIFKHVVQNGDTTEVGGDLEVDGKVKVNGKEDFTDKDGNPIDFGGGSGKPIVDSEEIVVDEGEEEIELHLAQDISNKINNSLQLPVAPPVATALVGVGTNGSQTNIGVGDGLAVENGVLKSKIPFSSFNSNDKIIEKIGSSGIGFGVIPGQVSYYGFVVTIPGGPPKVAGFGFKFDGSIYKMFINGLTSNTTFDDLNATAQPIVQE